MKKNVLILGDTGMLGGMAKGVLQSLGHKVDGLNRGSGFVVPFNPLHFRSMEHALDIQLNDSYSYIINCIGAIKPVFDDYSRIAEAIYTNSVFPYELSAWCNNNGVKLIHISTDCVYDGRRGKYVESDIHNADDIYGKSKSIGEPQDCMTIRTSIIGPEWGGNKRSLVEWFLSQNGGKVKGFTNHFWNGLTTLELSKAIDKIITHDLYKDGVWHLYSSDITKYELLCLMRDTWSLDIEIEPVKAKFCDRRLRSERSYVKLANQAQMAIELKRYINV